MSRLIPLDRAGTILDCLDHYAASQPDAPAYTFVGHKEEDRQVLSYGELHQRATGYATVLRDAGLAHRNVLLLFLIGLDSSSRSSPVLMRERCRSRPTWRATAITTPASDRSWKTLAPLQC